MASESTTSNVMLIGQSGYIKKQGSMTDFGVVNITDTNSSHSYNTGYIAEGSKISGTKLEETTDYINCENSMKNYLRDSYKEPSEGEYSVKINADNITSELTIPCRHIQEIADKLIKIKNISVSNPNNDTYTFVKNSNGYYESNNKGKDSTFAYAKLSFTLVNTNTVILQCINSGENNYDYGLLSNIDTDLSHDIGDSTNVYKSFRGQSSTSSVQITYSNLSLGNHYITIKYKKDNSNSGDNDSLQFKIINN